MMHPSRLENQMNNQCELDHQFYLVIPTGQPRTKKEEEKEKALSLVITSKCDASWRAHTPNHKYKPIHILLVSY